MNINFFINLVYDSNHLSTMSNHHDFRLRPRFYKDIDENVDVVRQKFINYTNQQELNLAYHEATRRAGRLLNQFGWKGLIPRL